MEYYQPIMSYVSITCLVLVGILVVASLYGSRRCYWIALGCYTVIALAAVVQALVPHVLGIQMANAFNSSRKVPVTAYLMPLLTLVGYLYPALSLYPFMSGRSGRIVAFTFAGLSVALAMRAFVMEAVRSPLTPMGFAYYHGGALAVFYLLLWLRVHDLKVATETK